MSSGSARYPKVGCSRVKTIPRGYFPSLLCGAVRRGAEKKEKDPIVACCHWGAVHRKGLANQITQFGGHPQISSQAYRTVKGKKYATPKTFIIVLTDANNNAPIFDMTYNVDVLESITIGSILFTVSATDEDSGAAGSLKYKIEEVIPSSGRDLFSIQERSGVVTLTQKLNYTSLSTFYRLKITATVSIWQIE
ncbi:Cadherin-related family member 2 [Merluccius polli]|uniref:Cadherin-related family member 2 n=1 Tax=Merluccius polli TaxID=89951 RepID=A0AA47MBQ8_MERPO|nr:Cadherin-related family member 2 [Merluccius polli]